MMVMFNFDFYFLVLVDVLLSLTCYTPSPSHLIFIFFKIIKKKIRLEYKIIKLYVKWVVKIKNENIFVNCIIAQKEYYTKLI